MSEWLHIIGVGEQGIESLPARSRDLVHRAEIIVAPQRVIEMLPKIDAEVKNWTPPLSGMVEKILQWRGSKTVILATGDPTYYGIGNTLVRHGVTLDEARMIPAPSAFSLACARLGWPQQDVETISLHGRHNALIAPLIQPGAKILALTSGDQTIRAVADILMARGYGESPMIILEHMDGEKEQTTKTLASKACQQSFSSFSTLAIECIAGPDAVILPKIAGLPDAAFKHDGQITKQEVRAVTLTALAPTPDGLLWDVGAGCGSVAIEWCRAARNARAICIEAAKTRCALIAENATELGVPAIEVIEGRAPLELHNLDIPDAVFIGGGLAEPDLFEVCWRALRPGGRMVVNVVTTEGEGRVMNLFATYGGDLKRLAISRSEPLGGKIALKPLIPVTQWHVSKPIDGGKND